MADYPEAVREYESLEFVPDGEIGFDPGPREVKAKADAAIRDLKAEARKWEWVATHYRGWDFTGPDKVGDRREQSIRNNGQDEVEWLVVHYEAEQAEANDD